MISSGAAILAFFLLVFIVDFPILGKLNLFNTVPFPIHYICFTYNKRNSHPSDRQLYVAEAEPDEEWVIPTSQKMATEPGVNQMQLIHVFDPYHSILNDEVHASFVFDSARLAIDTTD
ncbi:MAG: hypothetical protein M5U34_13050 [Chloroflexi bacterium]|nr:hypothetical protein [Chloroflexota bacterium]